jgi:mannose-1-phosphate guanylyltransferase/phosphomannomutase
VISDTVNTGIYVLEPQMLDNFEPGINFDFPRTCSPCSWSGASRCTAMCRRLLVRRGQPAEYMRASNDMVEGRVKVAEMGTHLGGGVWVGENVDIAPDAQLYGPIYLGSGVKIKGGVIIHGPTVMLDYSVVDDHAHVDRSIVWRNCYIGEGAELRGAIIGRQCSLKRKVVVFEGAIVGDSSVIGEGAVIHPGVKIWPDKEVEAGATVKTSIIWGAQGRRVLFGRYGVTGLVNVDLTPEFAAAGGRLCRHPAQGVDGDHQPRPAPQPAHAQAGDHLGAALGGRQRALDVRSVPIPVARYITRVSNDGVGGVHVRLSPYDSRVVDIKLL